MSTSPHRPRLAFRAIRRTPVLYSLIRTWGRTQAPGLRSLLEAVPSKWRPLPFNRWRLHLSAPTTSMRPRAGLTITREATSQKQDLKLITISTRRRYSPLISLPRLNLPPGLQDLPLQARSAIRCCDGAARPSKEKVCCSLECARCAKRRERIRFQSAPVGLG